MWSRGRKSVRNMLDYTGVNLMDKSRLTKIMTAVANAELAQFYGAVQGADESLRQSFCTLLSVNKIHGGDAALIRLKEVADPMTAVRAAAVCLLAKRLEGQEN